LGDFPEMLVELSGLNALLYDRRGHGQSSHFDVKHCKSCLANGQKKTVCSPVWENITEIKPVNISAYGMKPG
jgi:hypothetical protein